MITSKIDEIRLKLALEQEKKENKNIDFLNSVYDLKKSENSTRTDSLDYNNIKGITLEEIETLFKDTENRQLAKNLRLVTLFSNDDRLSKAMYDVVLGKPFDVGFDYLYNRYEDKHLYLNSNKNSLANLLHESISFRKDSKELKSNEVISQDRLDEVLLEINSFNFIDALNSSSKDLYDRYEDEEDYSFLYNDYILKYQQLELEYKKYDDINKTILNQYK